MRVRTSFALLAAAAATAMISSLVGTAPVGATTAGAGVGVTAVSPHLTDGFPCQGGGSASGGDAFSKFLLSAPASYTCHGDLYTSGVPGVGNSATFSGSGYDLSSGNAYSFTGTGTQQGRYSYSEPCAGGESNTGEAQGTLTLSVSGSGVVNNTPVTSASVVVNFWWSRIGVTAVVGIRGVKLVTSAGTVDDPGATGAAAAVFVPTSLPDCSQTNYPPAGAISIFSGSLTV